MFTFFAATGSAAATKTWVGSAGGPWTTAANWSPSGAPAASDDIIIPANQSANITAVPAIVLNSLTINGTCLLAAASSGNTITITTSMSIGAGKTATLGASSARIVFVLNGTATINGGLAFDAGSTVRNFTVNSGGILIVNPSGRVYDPAISVGGVFILSSGATLKIGNTGGILTGITIDTTVAINFGGTYQYTSGANYDYIGTAAQVTGNGLIQHTPANVTISNSAGVTFSAPTAMSGSLSIITGATANLGAFTHTVPALYLGGVLQASGTWGGTGSGATNINTTYFSPASGIVYVNTSLPGTTWMGTTSTVWSLASNWNNGVPSSSSNVTIPSGGNQPSIGAAAVCNSITINSGATLTITGANTLTVSGNWTNNGTFTANTSTVNFNGAAQTVGTGPYYNLTVSTSGLKTITGVTVNGIFSIEGRATVSAAPTYGAAATLQYNTATNRTVEAEWITPFAATGGVVVANTGIITLDANKVFNANVPLTLNDGARLADTTFLMTLNGNFINNGGTTSGSGGLTIAGTATQSIGGFTTTGTVSMTKTGGTATFTGHVHGGGLTINGNGGTLHHGTGWTHEFSGTWTRTNGTHHGGSSRVRFGGSVSGAGGTFTCGTSTVEWNGNAGQTIPALTYYNLALSGSGVKTVAPGATVSGSPSFSGTATMSGTPTYSGTPVFVYDGNTPRTTGAELPATVSSGLTINNAAGVTLGAATTVTGTLTLTDGNLITTNTNLLTLGSAAVVSGGSESSFVDGPVSHTWTAATEAKTYPIGTGTVYRPVTVQLTNPASPTLRLQMVNSNAGGVKGGLNAISVIRYFQSSLTGGTAANGGTIRLAYGADDGAPVSASLVVAQSATAGGTYSSLGMSANDTSSVTSGSYNPAAGNFLLIGSTVSNVLPVELVSFTASVSPGVVALCWRTATEVNNAGFEIERQRIPETGERGPWKKIGFTEGHGTTNAPQSYSYSDNSASGKIVYRLKQIDRDGKFEYSKDVEATVAAAPAVFALSQNYPNPFNPTTLIHYSIASASHVTLKVYDLLGREVAVLVNGPLAAGAYTAQFDASRLSSGAYFYRLDAGSFSRVKQLSLMK